VAAAGDADLDGVPDLLIGGAAPGTHFQGRVDGVSGRPRAKLASVTAGRLGRVGSAVDGGFDFDADGEPDFAGGAPRDVPGGQFLGAAYVYSGTGAGAIATLLGEHGSSYTGLDVHGIGDLDGDGGDEVAVGAPRFTTSPSSLPIGRVYVLSR
jgi:hypothetical protein